MKQSKSNTLQSIIAVLKTALAWCLVVVVRVTQPDTRRVTVNCQ